MSNKIAAVRALLSAVRQWLVKTARSEARYAWECFKERFGAAAEQAWHAWVDDEATRAKAWCAWAPQGGFRT